MKSLMIIDDEQIVRQAIRMLIPWEDYGFDTFYEAAGGEMALKTLRPECVDLLFVDIKMNGMSGIELLRIMNDEGITYPSIYVITSYDDFDFVRNAFRYGVKDFIVKSEINKALLIEIALKESPSYYISSSTSNRRMQNALKYIESNIDQKITLQSVADMLAITPSHFSKLFSKEMGVTFNKYITHRRIEYAARLLRETNDYVYLIAQRSGFSSFIYFNKVFKSHIGMTPIEYRNGSIGE